MVKKPPFKLPYPFNYYWKKYVTEMKCPFCNSDIECTFENYDIVHCSGYGRGGYLVIYQDAAYAGGDGMCKNCTPTDPIMDGKSFSIENVEETSPFREVVKGEGFLCENCHHGVYFDKQIVFQELFMEHDENKCDHCQWHNTRSPSNTVKKGLD